MAVVDVWIAAGQSNMYGMGTGSQAPVPDPALAWEWDSAVGIVPLDEPNSWSSDYKPNTGSMLPAFASAFSAASGRPSLIVRTAIGGTSLLASNATGNGGWYAGGTRFPDAISRTNSALSALASAGHTVANVHVLWHQGERDAQGGNDLGTYKAALVDLVDRFRASLSRPTLKLYVIRIGHKINSLTGAINEEAGWEPVRQAQVAACSENPTKLLMTYLDCVEFPARGWMKTDGIHYTQNGYNAMGTAVGTSVAEDFSFAPAPPPPINYQAKVTSHAAEMLLLAPALPPLPVVRATAGSIDWTVPAGVTSIVIECEGGGGGGGNGGVGLKGGSGGGGAYAKAATPVTPGELLRLTSGAAGSAGSGSGVNGGTGGTSEVIRLSNMAVLCRAVGGAGGVAGVPASDGAGGAAASCIGDITTSGQNGGVTGIDNGGNGAAPLGGAGGVGPGPVAGASPGGGGAGATAGASNPGGAGGSGLVKLTLPTA